MGDMEDEFDVEPNLTIDAVPIKPLMTPGFEGALDNPLMPKKASILASSLPKQGASAEHMLINERRDLSGWGVLGKLHPKMLVKDKAVAAFHNRPLDPRYLRLVNYGNLAQMPPRASAKVNTFNEKMRGMTIGMF